jgi:hypothetical protein
MKTRTVIAPAAVVFLVVVVCMVVEWGVASRMGASSAIHNYHGICNVGVGRPYADFVHQLRTMAESGDTNRLVTVLRRADERSRAIFDVWLGDDAVGASNADAYKKSVDEILK